MATINEKLQAIQNSKNAIKNAINAKGGTAGDILSEYATAIEALPSGGGDIYEVHIEEVEEEIVISVTPSIDNLKETGKYFIKYNTEDEEEFVGFLDVVKNYDNSVLQWMTLTFKNEVQLNRTQIHVVRVFENNNWSNFTLVGNVESISDLPEELDKCIPNFDSEYEYSIYLPINNLVSMQIIRDNHYNQKYNQYFLKLEVGGIIVLYDRVIDLAETTPTWSEWEPRLNFEETRTITANGTYNFDNTIYITTVVNVPSNETIG